MRVVMPLRMAVEILQRCDLRTFARDGVVVLRQTQLSNPAQSVCFLKKKCEWFTVAYVHPNWIHCKGLELALNYHERMIRYAFRVPPKDGKDGEQLEDAGWLGKRSGYIEKWIDLIIKEKQWQMMHTPEHMWPPWPPRSEVKKVWDMPIVIGCQERRRRRAIADNDIASRGPPSDVIIPVV